VVILLDSLDEVPQSHLNEIKGWIESICSSMGDSKVILTSRPIDIAYGLRTFKEYEVEPFQHDKQNDFIKRWFKYYEEEDEGDKMIEYLDSSEMITVRGASKLSGTPLFLTMMCIQYRDKGEISKTPGELIENYTIILLRGKGGQAGIPSRRIFELKQTTLETIAFYLFAKDSDRFNLKNISKVIRDVHEDFGIPTDMPYVKGTLEDITLRSNILIDVKNVSWEFSHKVFLEFFVARYHYSIQCTDENYDPPWVTETDENIYRRYENIEYYFDNLMLQ
jgi:predicted NACHT family NTPase